MMPPAPDLADLRKYVESGASETVTIATRTLDWLLTRAEQAAGLERERDEASKAAEKWARHAARSDGQVMTLTRERDEARRCVEEVNEQIIDYMRGIARAALAPSPTKTEES